ncbi:MAG: hypothetical protein HUJ68_11950 [Clostridia bacterium]|nr:hypothetical protein [Clostridia bacterium]
MPCCGGLALKKTTFESAQKDLFKIVQLFINNDNLKKLLYYSTKDALERPDLTQEQSLGLLHKNIRVVPQLKAEEELESYIIISFDSFATNSNNPEFRDNVIIFDVLCNLNYWVMENYKLRPYLIMGEIDGMLHKSRLNGIGTLDFAGADLLLLNNEWAGYSLTYRVINDV